MPRTRPFGEWLDTQHPDPDTRPDTLVQPWCAPAWHGPSLLDAYDAGVRAHRTARRHRTMTLLIIVAVAALITGIITGAAIANSAIARTTRAYAAQIDQAMARNRDTWSLAATRRAAAAPPPRPGRPPRYTAPQTNGSRAEPGADWPDYTEPMI